MTSQNIILIAVGVLGTVLWLAGWGLARELMHIRNVLEGILQVLKK